MEDLNLLDGLFFLGEILGILLLFLGAYLSTLTTDPAGERAEDRNSAISAASNPYPPGVQAKAAVGRSSVQLN
jgi:hypothetical protein